MSKALSQRLRSSHFIAGINIILLRQFTQYSVAGGIAFAGDFSCLYLLTEIAHLHYLASATFAFLLGLVLNYSLCIGWIFKYRALTNRHHEFFIFGTVGILGLLLNNLLLWQLTDTLHLHYLASKAIATTIVLGFNFLSRRHLLFTERTKYSPQPDNQ